MTTTSYLLTGIVEGVKAHRIDGEVENLTATLRFVRSDYKANKWDKENMVDIVIVSLPPDSPVNAGEAVIMSLAFASPEGQRFAPALPVGSVSDDDDE